MSLRQSFLTVLFSTSTIYMYTYLHTYMHVHVHGYMHIAWATVCQSQHEVKTITVCQAFIMNSDAEEESVGLLKALRRGRRD